MFPLKASSLLQVGALLRQSRVSRGLLLAVVLLATSMIIGDGVLTPAISVISAIQGLTNASPNINTSAPRCANPLFACALTPVRCVCQPLRCRNGSCAVSLFRHVCEAPCDFSSAAQQTLSA